MEDNNINNQDDIAVCEIGSAKAVKKEVVFYEITDFFRSFAGVLFVMLLILSVFVRYAVVDGSSMVPTFTDGDRTIVADAFYTPQRGDVVAIFEVKTDKKALIKRIIGLPGDVIDILDDGVYRNGQKLEEPYLTVKTEKDRGDMEFPVTVPKGCIFVMGDNRNASRDSRYGSVGFVKVEDIIGRVVLRFFPLDSIEAF